MGSNACTVSRNWPRAGAPYFVGEDSGGGSVSLCSREGQARDAAVFDLETENLAVLVSATDDSSSAALQKYFDEGLLQLETQPLVRDQLVTLTQSVEIR